MKRIVLAILGVLTLSSIAGVTVTAQPVMAANCGDGKAVLGFKPWYDGLECDGNGEIQAPAQGDEDALVRYIWAIVLNISFDLSVAIGYLALAMVVYGGYQYIMSQGDPGRAAKAKTTLTSAVIGVVIAMGASVIVNTVKTVLRITQPGWNQGDFTKDMVADAFGYAYSMAGIVAVAFIVKSGVEFMLAKGEPGKIQKAQHGLIFAIIGLVVVILASIITNVIISTVGGAL